MANRIVGRCDRIALHIPTDRKYLVQQVNRDYGLVFCWGEVERFKGLKTYHGESKQLPIGECQIAPCFKTEQLVTELAVQRCKVEGRPYWFTRNGNMRMGPPDRERLEWQEAARQSWMLLVDRLRTRVKKER